VGSKSRECEAVYTSREMKRSSFVEEKTRQQTPQNMKWRLVLDAEDKGHCHSSWRKLVI